MSGRLRVALLSGARRAGRTMAALDKLGDQAAVHWVLGPDSGDLHHRYKHKVQFIKPNQWENVCHDNSVDAIVVTSPDVNVNMIRRALHAGKAVFCDRPMSLQPAAITTCYEQAEHSRTTLMISSAICHDPVLQIFKERLISGHFGHVTSMTWQSVYQEEGDVYKGCVSRDVEAISWLLGQAPTSISSTKRMTLIENQPTPYTLVSTLLQYPHITATMELYRGGPGCLPESETVTANGCGDDLVMKCRKLISEDSSSSSTQLTSPYHFTDITSSKDTETFIGKDAREKQSLDTLLHLFTATVREGLPYAEGEPDATLRTVCITEAIKKSNQTGSDVTVNAEQMTDNYVRQSLWLENPAQLPSTDGESPRAGSLGL